MDSRIIRANLLLFTAAAVWGGTFVAQRMGMEHLGPLSYSGIRFLIGALALAPLAWIQKSKPPADFLKAGSRPWLWGSLVIGSVLFLGINLQQKGLVTTTAGNAGFITGLYVVIVPILGLLWGHRAGAGVWLGVAMGAAGLYLLSVTETFTLAPGDAWVMACAVVWAGHVWLIGWLSPRVQTAVLAFGQAAVCGVFSLGVSFIAGETITLEAMKAAWGALLWGGFMSVGVGFTLQVAGQKDSPPTHAAIILSLEAVVAALAGWLVLGESLTRRSLIGAGLMLTGMLVAQLWGRPAKH
jgi:drug/metabolite transporter (DMT)-like permease